MKRAVIYIVLLLVISYNMHYLDFNLIPSLFITTIVLLLFILIEICLKNDKQ